MKNRLTLVVLMMSLSIVATSGAAREFQQAGQPPLQPGQRVIQTPFGQANVREEVAPVVQQPALPPQPPAADAQPAPQAAANPVQDETLPIQLDLDNADIHQIIRIIGDALRINYIIDPAVQGTVNIHTAGGLRQSDWLSILETMLKINGATMVRVGNFYQVVPAGSAVRQPLQVQDQRTVAPDDQMVLQVLRMKFVSAGDMSRLLSPYLSEGASMVVQETGNVILITERRSNLRKLLEIVDIFDMNAFEGERVRMYPVRNNLARQIVEDLRAVFSGYAMSEASAVRLVVIERLNAILVIAPNVAVFPEVMMWLERLDQPSAVGGLRTYVYKVRNSKAADLQGVLSQLYSAQSQFGAVVAPAVAPAQAVQQAQLPVSPETQPQVPPNLFGAPVQSAQPAQAVLGTVQAGNIRIIADTMNNMLLIQTTPQQYSDIERTLLDLDVLRRQVLVEAQIYEVVLDESMSLGLSAILQAKGTLGANPMTTASFASSAGSPPSFGAQTFAFVGRTREIVGFINASENRSRVRSLSAPSVMVGDNQTANFTVGADIPVPTSSSVTAVQAGGTNLFAQTIAFRSVGVILQVSPQINDSGTVTLQISQEVSQAGANTLSSIVAPVIGKSSVSSSIVLRDGQTVALGGFIRDQNDVSRSRVPLLGRIPGLGLLFGNTRNSQSRTELVILITPHVLRTHDEADLATDALKLKLREIQKNLN